MNPSQIDLALVLSHYDLPFDLSTFSKRLALQKKIYLAQLTGVDLGYRFGWYLRGPYSTGLSNDAFGLLEEIKDGDREHEGYNLHEETTELLDQAMQLWETPPRFSGSEDDWLELLASLHYLRHIAYRPKGATRDFEDCFKELVEAKPRFTSMKSQAQIAWNRLNEFGLIEQKTLSWQPATEAAVTTTTNKKAVRDQIKLVATAFVMVAVPWLLGCIFATVFRILIWGGTK